MFARAIAETPQGQRQAPAEYHPTGIPGKQYPCPGCAALGIPATGAYLVCNDCTHLYRHLNSHPDATPVNRAAAIAA